MQSKRTKAGIVFAGVFASLILATFLFMAIGNSGEGLLVGHDKVTYDGRVLELTPGEIKILGPLAVKDSTRVYFSGELIGWADAGTFEHLGSAFYRDRNGIYREKIKLFGTNTLAPVEGDYDVETFRAVGAGHAFYKDKNSVYYMNLNMLTDKSPLQKVKIGGIDAATFEVFDGSHVWYRDAARIYFGDWVNIKACPEIDSETFEIVSFRVMKDKNHVYYLTRGLKSEGETATERDDYAILKDAHAPTFAMIDNDTYADKDTEWTISRE